MYKPTVLDSTDIEILKSAKVEELKRELRFRHLPDRGNKEELVDFLLSDNERVIADNLQESLIASRNKQSEDTKKLLELQQTVDNYEKFNKSNSNQIPIEILSQIANTQKLLSEKLTLNNCNQVQIVSTNDTASAISVYTGKKTENISEWLKEVERVSKHAHWTSSLTLVNAVSRLRGTASNWHKVSGRQVETWEEWREKIIERFKVKMSFSDFLQFQNKRLLRHNESIVEYIFDKDAILENAPFKMAQSDRVSLILEGITDNIWAVPLATAMCNTVPELIDHAIPLDTIRKISSNQSDTKFKNKSIIQTRDTTKSVHRFNPSIDKKEEQMCFKCKHFGHVSYDCTVSVNNTENSKSKGNSNSKNKKSSEKTPQVHKNENTNYSYNNKSVNCIATSNNSELVNISQIPVTINGSITIDALPDNGSCVTLLRKCFAPTNTIIHEWQDGPYATPEGDCTLSGWITLRIQVGKIDYTMPKVGLCDSLPIAMILGRDWQTAVHATIIIEPSGAICINTPSTSQEFACVKSRKTFIGCIVQSKYIQKPLVTKITPVSKATNESVMNSNSSLSIEQQQELDSLVHEYNDIFSSPENELGEFPNFQMEINLTNNRPIKCKPYKASEIDKEFMREQVEKWLKSGVCRMSKSPYGAPAFVIEQPHHESTPKRFVVDYSRTINKYTIKDPFPIDQMDDMVHKIAGKKYKSMVDVKHAFNNFKIREQDIFKTAAITPDHHIEFCRVIFGLTNAPAVLARAISTAYNHLIGKGLAKYYDDLAAAHDSFEEHIQFLRSLFETTRCYNLKFTKSKCEFAVKELKILGRILDEKGDRPDPNRIEAVNRYQSLNTIHELRSFLGFANTLRRYIKNFAKTAKPLTDKLSKKKSNSDFKTKNYPISLNNEEHQAFVKLKTFLVSAPILAHFSPAAPTTVETDASYDGLGACLSQIQDGELKIIEYASRSLKDSERRYHSNELEVTAVHWAVTEKFRLYLVGKSFKLITDNYSTAYILNKAKLNRKFARYVVDLAAFDMTPIFRNGRNNKIADHLSRYPQPEEYKNVCLAIITSPDSRLHLAQQTDPFCKQVANKLTSNNVNNQYKQYKNRYKYENEILVCIQKEHGRDRAKIVIPFSVRQSILKLCHDNSGYFDAVKTLSKIRSKYWWSTMRKDTKLYIKGCEICQQVNRRTTLANGYLGQLSLPNTPFEIISADHLSLPITKAGNCYILVHICHATRYLIARPTCTYSN